MTSLLACINTINDMDSFASCCLRCSALCKCSISSAPTTAMTMIFSSCLGNSSSLFHLRFSSFNVLITHFYFARLLKHGTSQIKSISMISFNHLNNAFTSKLSSNCKRSILRIFSLRSSMHLLTTLCLILAIAYWLYRLSRAIYNLLSYFNIRAFYAQALDIKPVKTRCRAGDSVVVKCVVCSLVEWSGEHDLAWSSTTTADRPTNTSFMYPRTESNWAGYSQSLATI